MELSGALESAISNAPHGTIAHMRYSADTLMPLMHQLREAVDGLEAVVDDNLWPLPSYQEMLFFRSALPFRSHLRQRGGPLRALLFLSPGAGPSSGTSRSARLVPFVTVAARAEVLESMDELERTAARTVPRSLHTRAVSAAIASRSSASETARPAPRSGIANSSRKNANSRPNCIRCATWYLRQS